MHEFDPELNELFERSVHRLRAAEVFDAEAFSLLFAHVSKKASLLADEYVVSKQVLASLVGARDSIRNSAPFLPESANSLELADEFELLLSMIALGIDPAMRVGGSPRIT